jgi:hypothetical protein
VCFTDYIRPICLPFGLNITGEEETKYQIAGWGKTDFCKYFDIISCGLSIKLHHAHNKRKHGNAACRPASYSAALLVITTSPIQSVTEKIRWKLYLHCSIQDFKTFRFSL